MTVSQKEILDAIANMSVMEVVDLVSAMEEKFGVSAAAIAAVPTAAVSGPEVEEEAKNSFDVVLTSFGANKVSVIKAVRSMTSLGLKEAKDLVESAPATVKEGVPTEGAEDMKKQLEEVGASVELK